MKTQKAVGIVLVAVSVAATQMQNDASSAESRKLVAHRGASAYAPEHTLAAYRLALDQGADYVEQDLAVTRDGVLICLHDDTLERTTNVEDVFPTRGTANTRTGRPEWLAVNFTLAEIKQLDAGSWFDPRFAGEKVPTWEEAVRAVGTRAGLYPELKSPPLYRTRGIDMVGLFVESLGPLGLNERPRGTLIVQSFDDLTVRELARELPAVPRTLLIEARDGQRWLSPAGMKEAATFATDLGPAKLLLDGHPEIVAAAHGLGLTVTPYTFTTRRPPGALSDRFVDVGEEMRYFLYELKVDGLFTDNPDRFPRGIAERALP
jgi:glycerophosphoryl diester phosphodiesterase